MPAPSTPFIYFQNPLCTILYCQDAYVQLSWTDAPATEDDLRGIYEHTLKALLHYRTGKLLTDHRLRRPLPLSTQTWIAQQWVPRARQEAGYRRCAIVENQTPLGRLAARAVGDALTVPLDFAYFDTVDSASSWLMM